MEGHASVLGAGAFLNDRLMQDAIIRSFEVIGEASRNIRRRYPVFANAGPRAPPTCAIRFHMAISPPISSSDGKPSRSILHQ
jgi:hypothetical protein